MDFFPSPPNSKELARTPYWPIIAIVLAVFLVRTENGSQNCTIIRNDSRDKIIGTGSVGAAPIQGNSVSLSSDGNTFAFTGSGDDSGEGATWIFTRSNGIWTQQGLKLVGFGSVGNSVSQGISVSLSSVGDTLAVGGFLDDSNEGATWVFI